MLLLITYVLIAVGFSFLCSIAEAVLLSVTPSFIAAKKHEQKPYASVLGQLKSDINRPLAVILSLNTIAHTIGAAGAGAQAAYVFGNVYLGLFSAILTLIILIFSEIIPKALGAYYWKQLAPSIAYILKYLVKILAPFVWLSKILTHILPHGDSSNSFNRQEFAAMALIGEQEGELRTSESKVVQNIFKLSEVKVKTVMTPRSVIFGVPQDSLVRDYVEKYRHRPFSRIPLYNGPDDITGFALKTDILLASSEGKGDKPVILYRREMEAIPVHCSLLQAFDTFIEHNHHIMLVVDEYGQIQGLLSLEDILESLLGLEITDESDNVADMQRLARKLGEQRRKKMGLVEED